MTDDPGWIHPAHQARTREKRDLLLRAGEEVFGEHGYEASFVREIAKRAGVSIGGFYRRFKDKEAFFLALQQENVARTKDSIDIFFSSEWCDTLPVEEVIEKYIVNTRRVVTKRKGFYRALNELHLAKSPVGSQSREIDIHIGKRMGEFLIRRGVIMGGENHLYSSGFATRVINSVILTLVLNIHAKSALDDPKMAKELARMIMNYWQLNAVSPKGKKAASRSKPLRKMPKKKK